MKPCVTIAMRAASLCIIASADKSQARTQEELLRRLEAKIDALSHENVKLRDRVSSIESSHPAPRAPARLTSASNSKSEAAPSAAYPAPSETARDALAANRP